MREREREKKREQKRDLVLLRLSLCCDGHDYGSAIARMMDREREIERVILMDTEAVLCCVVLGCVCINTQHNNSFLPATVE